MTGADRKRIARDEVDTLVDRLIESYEPDDARRILGIIATYARDDYRNGVGTI